MQCPCAVLYCCLRPVLLCHIFRHYFMNGRIFGKKGIEYQTCVLILSIAFIWNIYNSKNNSARYYHKCTYMSSSKLEIWVFSTYFRNIGNIKFMKIRIVGAELFHADGRDRQYEGNSRFSQFCKRFWKWPVYLKKDSSITLHISQNTFKHVHRSFSAS